MPGWFRNVLYVVLDVAAPSDGLADAVRVADWFDASLSVQTVVPDISRRHRRLGLDPTAFGASAESSLRTWIDEQVAFVPDADATVAAIHVDNGRMPVEVVSRVLRDRHDLVIVSPSSSSDRLASVRRLARVCPCPLLVLRRPVDRGNVLVAVDPDDRLELNAMLLSVAKDWASAAGVEVDAVHAFDPIVSGELGPFGAAESAAFAERVRSEHVDMLDELIERVGAGWVRTCHVVRGRPTEAIIETARSSQSSLVVVGTAGRRMAALLIGNTVDRVLARSDLSVLIVKPPGFVPQLDVEIDPVASESAVAS